MFRATIKINAVEEFTVKRNTPRFITYIDSDGGEKASLKNSNKYRWFEDKESAKNFLIQDLNHRVKVLKLAIAVAEKSLEKVKGY